MMLLVFDRSLLMGLSCSYCMQGVAQVASQWNGMKHGDESEKTGRNDGDLVSAYNRCPS